MGIFEATVPEIYINSQNLNSNIHIGRKYHIKVYVRDVVIPMKRLISIATHKQFGGTWLDSTGVAIVMDTLQENNENI